MDYEKKYKDALKRAREKRDEYKRLDGEESFVPSDIEYIFPELKESEDERIRKAIIECVKNYGPSSANPKLFKSMLSWLEKQDEQKPVREHDFLKISSKSYSLSFINYLDAHLYEGKMCVSNGECEDIENAFRNADWGKIGRYYNKFTQKPIDKVEPKFKVGDWIVSNLSHEDYRICKILKIENGNYTIESTYGYKGYNTFETFEKDYHLWTIQDAKDGDMLASYNGCPFIYRESDDLVARFYCCVNINNNLSINNGVNYCGLKESTKPATKEQRYLLFQKMKEAGYEWNAEKKELIENVVEEELNKDLQTKIAQKPAWSEEDSEWYMVVKESILERWKGTDNKDLIEIRDGALEWLKSIKERMKGE